MPSYLVTIKRDDEILKRLAVGLKRSPRRIAGAGIETVGVYDILPTNCMRKSYYMLKLDAAEPPEHPVMPYIRGRAVEGALARVLFANAAAPLERHKRYEKGGIVCYTDIADSDRIIEIKDTSTGRRLDPEDLQFKGYLMQVLYYMVIAEKEEVVLLINYSSKESLWHHNDSSGRSWFYRPPNATDSGIECWQVFMSKNDYARELLWEQMRRRKDAFLQATRANDVSMLPRIRNRDRRLKCLHCPFFERCMHQDSETEEARVMANDLELLDVRGFLT